MSKELFVALDKAVKSSNNKKIIAAADKVLQALPDDADAVKCKVIAQLRSNQYAEAIQTISNSEHAGALEYEHAYALFRKQDYVDCLRVIEGAEEDSFRMKELKAQALYRLERFDEAIELYHELLNEKPCMERRTNLVACYAGATFADPEKETPSEVMQAEDDAFEHTYNRSLVATAQHRIPTAATLVKQAQQQCVDMLKEDDPDITQEEIDQELALLKVQEGVILQQQGEEERAKRIYLDVIRFNQDSTTIVAVASNNIVAVNKDRDVFNSKHRMRATRAEGLDKKLWSTQKMIIAFNQCLLLLHSNAIAKCRDACADLRKQYPSSTVPSLIEAYTYLKERKVKNKAERLQALCDEHPNDEILALVLAHEYARHGDYPHALSALQRVSTLAFKPAYVGYAVALCRRLHRPDVATEQLDSAIAHWKKQQAEGSEETLQSLLRLRGELLLQQRKYSAAVNAFQDLIDADPEDMRAVASLIVALAQVDIEKAEQVASSMPPLEMNEDEPLNVDELEQARKLRVAKTSRRAPLDKLAEALASNTAAAPAPAAAKPKRRRKRKGKLPKNAEEGVEPDPNRWLPKWQRKGGKGKKKNKKKGGAVKHGTQGAATEAEMAKLDASLLPDAPPPKTASASRAVGKGKPRKKKGGRRR
ncbi:hypothetical protein PTSG_00912 [Salpingoeca rosetta]|uniref:Signal recognition particle subunit SRP72 n=1 Tax=Salpingoeca rosetta (strain ATCC 50818 / BSB-021) TaxID=946362 RepID=F2TXU8_SALR5|nr:uncharacterized protein PTSG_00912 [Salpingoeca rosetta]EGD76207.1 hypothetical protein PTSG_00912 [Salpingoeca rosetta]|eukprot:XP_004998382.1 hypothetical protein PTSG_00912 [Salpingoeca rosetta]